MIKDNIKKGKDQIIMDNLFTKLDDVTMFVVFPNQNKYLFSTDEGEHLEIIKNWLKEGKLPEDITAFTNLDTYETMFLLSEKYLLIQLPPKNIRLRGNSAFYFSSNLTEYQALWLQIWEQYFKWKKASYEVSYQDLISQETISTMDPQEYAEIWQKHNLNSLEMFSNRQNKYHVL